MDPRSKRALLQFFGLVVLVGVAAVAFLAYAMDSWLSGRDISDASAIRATQEWGRLSDFPTSAHDMSVEVTGSPFTRGFRVSFTAPADDLEAWLKKSPGTADAKPTTPSAKVRHYDITPGGGAQHAEVTVDAAANRVSIYVFWS